MQTLTKPAVTARATERAVQELLNEFFKSYFTGLPHSTPLGPVTFPLCDLFFNQTELPDPAGKAQIHIVFTDLRPTACWTDSAIKRAGGDSTFTIYVRAANQGADANETDFLCRSVADNVKELFQSQQVYALAQKGLRRPRLARGPIALQSIGFQTRMLIVTAQVYYNLLFPERST